MHYKNGRVPRAGDLVRGNGSNLKYEFTGVLVGMRATKCVIATVTPYSGKWFGTGMRASSAELKEQIDAGHGIDVPIRVDAKFEYGEPENFIAINPETGSILEPEPTEQQLTDHEKRLAAAGVALIANLKEGWTPKDHQLIDHLEEALHDVEKAKAFSKAEQS